MATFSGGFSGRPVDLRLNVWVNWQDVPSNTSNVGWNLQLVKTGNYSPWNNDPSPWSVSIAGIPGSGTFTYNMNGPIGQTVTIASGAVNISHSADGTFSAWCTSSATDNGGLMGSASNSGWFDLPTIPRASTPSWSGGLVAGTAKTINTNRASTSFTHDIDYFYGGASGEALVGIGASGSWTPPMSLLNEFPNSVTGTGTFRTGTYSGSTYIGYTDVAFNLSAPASVVPTFGTTTHSEATAGVAANVGAYVQNVSKLALTVTSAAGAYGSTITGYSTTVAGQVLSGQSVTSNPINASGTVPIVTRVTDSRGRYTEETVNITVLAWAPPTITAITAQRADSGGTPQEEGTYIRVNVQGSVKSLVNTTERNALVYRVYTRTHGSGSWTLKATTTPTTTLVGGWLTYNGYTLVSTYAVDAAFDVRVELADDFAYTPYETSIATAAVFQHWDGMDGIGIGKYRENGMLDVAGEIYVRGGLIAPAGMFVPFAGTTAPAGWLLCDGQAVSRTTYSVLYAALGGASSPYGQGDGSTTFNVPNIKGRVPVGRDSGQTEFDVLGETGGAKTHTLTIAEMPSHMHAQNVSANTGGTATRTDYTGDAAGQIYPQGVETGSTGGGGAHNNLQPYMVTNYIIRA